MENHTHLLTSRLDNDKILQAGVKASSAVETLRLNFHIVPRGKPAQTADHIWRILINPIDQRGVLLPIELHGDAVMGIKTSGSTDVDIDLGQWEGYKFGVSRRHLQLRPTASKLFVIDLGSTNGTHVNGLPIGPNWAHSLTSGDVLTMGLLNLRITMFAPQQAGVFEQLASD